MHWTKELVGFYKRNYRELMDYDLSPFQADHRLKGFPIKKVSSFNAPFIGQAELNVEFDLALKIMGPLGEYVYRTKFIGENLPRKFPAKDIEEKTLTVQGELWNILNGFKVKKSRIREAFR